MHGSTRLVLVVATTLSVGLTREDVAVLTVTTDPYDRYSNRYDDYPPSIRVWVNDARLAAARVCARDAAPIVALPTARPPSAPRRAWTHPRAYAAPRPRRALRSRPGMRRAKRRARRARL